MYKIISIISNKKYIISKYNVYNNIYVIIMNLYSYIIIY